MKLLDRYILTQFLKTFGSVFTIIFFIFILQTVWLFIGELAGKDLDFGSILKFLVFAMPSVVPLVLPLSVLLASIMTFGDLSENYEFAAMKSSGVSLQRAMRGLIVFIVILSACSFFFANNVIPYSQYRFQNIKANIAQEKPAMAISEGQFNDVGSFNIKVDKKSGDNGNFLTGVTIHKKSLGRATTVIKAKTGELRSSEDSNILQLILHDGYQFEDVQPKKYEDRKKMPFAKTAFKTYTMNMDLSKLNENDIDREQISNTSVMLDLGELTYTLDSLNVSYDKELRSYADNITVRTGLHAVAAFGKGTAKDTVKASAALGLLEPYTKEQRSGILNIAKNNIENTQLIIDDAERSFEDRQKNINSHWLAVYEKFVISYACLLMFFIGAPLGAIIRKGGLGLPIVFAIAIFITYHFVNTFGKKMAQENGIDAFTGAWMSSLLLTPLALFLTRRATNDQQVTLNFDWLMVPLRKLFAHDMTKPSFLPADRILNLDAIEVIRDEEWHHLDQLSDDQLIQRVRDSKRSGQSEETRIKILKLLEARGVSQRDLFRDKKLFDEWYELLIDDINTYRFRSKVTMVVYLLSLVMAAVYRNNPSQVWIAVAGLLIFVFFFVTLYKAQRELNVIARALHTRIGINLFLCVILGMPLYPIFHFYNRAKLNKALAENNI